MIVGKWNYSTREYDDYEIPDDWNTPLYSKNMNELINCASCGREMSYGMGYTSKEIHNDFGMGYYVCEDCYVKEFTRARYFAFAK